jgi:hypothetical protein
MPASTPVAGVAVTTDIAPALTGESDYHQESDHSDGDHQANHDPFSMRPHASTVLRWSLDPEVSLIAGSARADPVASYWQRGANRQSLPRRGNRRGGGAVRFCGDGGHSCRDVPT